MQNKNQKKGDLGQVWTPEPIVDKMVNLIQNKGSILEPSAGCGRFVDKLKNITALEIDSTVVSKKHNYIIKNFFDYSVENKFSTIITNPPYVNGRLLNNSWFGDWNCGVLNKTANAYLHFIEKSIHHLEKNGELIFIIPASFFSDTSFGKPLRNLMFEKGSFTHIYFENNIKWDNADIDEIIIFRWQKDLKNNKVRTDKGNKFIINNNGFLWIIDFEPKGKIGDYFKASVGSAPLKADIENADNSETFDFYVKEGRSIKVCEKNRKNWPRVKDTKKIDKIFFVGRPIRRWPIFFEGNSEKHIDWVLIPKENIDVKKVSSFMNDWFFKNGESLGLIKNGRWKVGIKQIESCPINLEFYNFIKTHNAD